MTIMYIYDNDVYLAELFLKLSRKSKHTLYSNTIFPRKSCRLGDIV